jgi:hypothetical protein
MKIPTVLSLLIIVSSGYAANAAPFTPSDYSDVDVVSVTPRSPDVKPLVMAIFTREQQQRVAAAPKKDVFAQANSGR